MYLLAVVIGQLLISNLIKCWLRGLARPSIQRPGSRRLVPDGHTTAAAAVYAAAALVLGRGRSFRARTILTGVAVGIATAVAVSRVCWACTGSATSSPARAGLELVRDLFDRIRWPADAVRRARRGRAAGCGRRGGGLGGYADVHIRVSHT